MEVYFPQCEFSDETLTFGRVLLSVKCTVVCVSGVNFLVLQLALISGNSNGFAK